MQSREVQRRDNRGLMIGAGVAIAVILIAATWVLLFANSANSTPSPALSTTTSASRVGMGELRAVDAVNGSQAGMGDIRGVESLRAVGLAMGNLRALEADAAIAAVVQSPTVGMGDLRAERLPGGVPPTTSYVGMGDLRATP